MDKLKGLFPRRIEAKPEKVFLCLAIVFGLTIVFVTPPFQSPDEYAHFYRAYLVSQGEIIPDRNSTIPSSVINFGVNVMPDPFHLVHKNKQSIKTLLAQFSQPLNPSERVPAFQHTVTTYAYSPVAYLPQALGILLGRLANFPPILIHYMGRLANLWVWIILSWLALQTTPIGKWPLVLIALMPMTIFQGASNSPDALIFGLSFFFAAYVFKLAFGGDENIQSKQLILIYLTAFALAATKPLYIVLVGLFLFIPIRRLGNWKRYLGVFFILAAIGVVTALFWYYITQGIAVNGVNLIYSHQATAIVQNPLAFIHVVGNTLVTQILFYYLSFIGILGWVDAPLPAFIYVLYIPGFLAALLFSKNLKVQVNNIVRIISSFIFLLGAFFIFTYIFIDWTQPGALTIAGIQGRYFIPLAPLLILPFYNQRMPKPWWIGWTLTGFFLFVLIIIIRTLVYRYYVI